MLNGKVTENEYLNSKLRDVGKIFEMYNSHIEKRGSDGDDAITLLCKILEDDPAMLEFENSVIFIDRFWGFTPQEHFLIRQLNKISKRMYITFVTDAVDDRCNIAFSPTVKNIERLPEFTHECVRGREDSELTFLRDNFFAYPNEVCSGAPEQIKITKAGDIYRECEAAAVEILRLVREGARLRDIAVTARDLSECLPVLKKVMSGFGINLFADIREDILSHPLISFILSIADLFEYSFNYDSVFSFLKSDFSPLSRDEVDILENFALAYGLRGNDWTDDKRFENVLDRISEDDHDRQIILEIRDKFTKDLLEFRANTKGARSLTHQAGQLFGLLEKLNVYEKTEKRRERLIDLGEYKKAEEERQIWNVFVDTLDEAVDALGETRLTFSKFMSILKSGLAEHSIGSIPAVLDSIIVSPADRFVSGGIKYLFVLGVNEGEFPAANVSGGIFNGIERDILESAGIETSGGRQKSSLIEQQIIYKTLSHASEALYLSYKSSSADGAHALPSSIIRRIKMIFPDICVTEAAVQVSAADYTFLQLAKSRELSGDFADAYCWFAEREDYKNALALLNRNPFNNTVALSEETADELYKNGMFASVSKLESFAKCNFSYYAKYILKLKERKIFEFAPIDAGSFIHECLENCSRFIDASPELDWRGVTREQCNDIAAKMVEKALAGPAGKMLTSSRRYMYLTEKLKNLAGKNLYYISTHFKSGCFEPLGYELSFAPDGDFPPIKITLGGKTVTLTGKVDRADVYKTPDGAYIRIIDYKSSSRDLSLNDVFYGLNIQLITYLDALCADRFQPCGALYFNAHDSYIKADVSLEADELLGELQRAYKMKGIVLNNSAVLYAMDKDCGGSSDIIPAYIKKDGAVGGSSVLSAREFSLLRRHIKSTLRQLSGEILKGKIGAKPAVTNRTHACTYCDYNAVCAFERGMECSRYFDLKREEIFKTVNR